MKKEIKIDKLKLQIGDQEIELTVEELRELQYVIGNLIGKDKEYITIPQAPIEPYMPSHPVYPQVIPYSGTGDPLDNQILCGDGGFSSQDTLYSSNNLKIKYKL
jgi:hypothetical protein